MKDTLKLAAIDCLVSGFTKLTNADDAILTGAIEKLKMKLHVFEGEQARRGALPLDLK